ncbi:ras association domain-containing protein 3 isoform X1 [Syngnathoides biaculeatus]|uniref:ras association domain-containing protein 3 isoform X1 n=1 Tax=Syngnathoides biaculeatus TaxID=300417 RepID=UPI002ADE48C5|nr:ras association domain-containing protein 3 isoform X1 [Syngnathoides biaculeatus]
MKVIHHGARDLLPPSPPPGVRLRFPKGNKGAMVKLVRQHPSPQPPSLESLQAAWRSPERRSAGDPEEGRAGGPPRARKKGFKPPDVRTIFSPGEKDPRVKEERGEGHGFGTGGEGTWCDVCCGYIFHGGLTCAACKYACHAACRSRVTLDCHPPAVASPATQDRLNNNGNLATPTHDAAESQTRLLPPPMTWTSTMSSGYSSLEDDSEEYFFTARTSFFKKPLGKVAESKDVDQESKLRTEFSREEIRHKIEQYNTLTRDHLKMTLGSGGVYTGFIKVQMDLRRPVTARGGGGDAAAAEAFYLPRGVSNTLHVSSQNTVRQVIVALLNKFTVADNPAKYALYKRFHRDEQVYVCKLSDAEQPLFLRLLAGPDDATLGFILREQQTGEVLWDAFSVPELRNFLRILDKEEDEQKEALLRRYDVYRHRLKEALREVRGGAP